jgi:excisionase family DNA binding protein
MQRVCSNDAVRCSVSGRVAECCNELHWPCLLKNPAMGESVQIRRFRPLCCGTPWRIMSPSASEADAESRRRYAPMQQKSNDRVLICLPDGRWLALSAEAFREALQSGAELAGHSADSAALQPSSGLVTADEIGEATHMSRSTVYELAKAGVLPSVRVGRRIRFDRERVMSVLASRSTPTLAQVKERSDHGVRS